MDSNVDAEVGRGPRPEEGVLRCLGLGEARPSLVALPSDAEYRVWIANVILLHQTLSSLKKQQGDVGECTGDVCNDVGTNTVALLQEPPVGAQRKSVGMVRPMVECVADSTAVVVCVVTAKVSGELLLARLEVVQLCDAKVEEVAGVLQLRKGEEIVFSLGNLRSEVDTVLLAIPRELDVHLSLGNGASLDRDMPVQSADPVRLLDTAKVHRLRLEGDHLVQAAKFRALLLHFGAQPRDESRQLAAQHPGHLQLPALQLLEAEPLSLAHDVALREACESAELGGSLLHCILQVRVRELLLLRERHLPLLLGHLVASHLQLLPLAASSREAARGLAKVRGSRELCVIVDEEAPDREVRDGHRLHVLYLLAWRPRPVVLCTCAWAR
mmetsp:Transcript_13965/g.55094  ORF Transcript_13965/g.55094 Transcript_13965/m.55094 type:complete len:384 (-) Transcript_13965:608-1759(-)